MSAAKDTASGLGLLLFGWLALRVLRFVYRLMAILIFIGITVGIWRNLKEFPPMQQIKASGIEYPVALIISICGYIVDYVADNWLPLCVGAIFWFVLTSKKMLTELNKHTSSTLRAAVALLTYFEVEIETDAMKEMRSVGAWQMMKNGFEDRVIISLLGIGPVVDEYSTKSIRHGQPITLQADVENQLSKTEQRVAKAMKDCCRYS